MTATTEEPLKPWSRTTVYFLGALVGGCALAASGFELYSLARNAGFSWPVSLALPIGLDAGAAGSAVLWVVAARGSRRRREGHVTALVLVASSAACNGLSVLVPSNPDARVLPTWAVTLVACTIAVAFPLVAARMVHLILTVRDDAATAEAARKRLVRLTAVRLPDIEPAGAKAEPATNPAAEPRGDVDLDADPIPVPVPAAVDEDEALMEKLRDLPTATTGPTAGVLPVYDAAYRALGTTHKVTRRLFDQLRAEQGGSAVNREPRPPTRPPNRQVATTAA